MKPGDFVFVYGTLRPGERAFDRYMKSCEHLGQDRILGNIYDLGSCPGLKTTTRTFNTFDPAVVGDVFVIPDERTAQALDYYEGYPNLYTRILTNTESGVQVWVYVYNGHASEGALIPSGDWKSRSDGKRPEIKRTGEAA